MDKPLDTLIPKKEVAKRLGVGAREVERLTSMGRLSKTLLPPENGAKRETAFYDLASVEREIEYRKQRGQPGIVPAGNGGLDTVRALSESQQAQTSAHQQVARILEHLPELLDRFAPAIPVYAYMSVPEAAAHIRMSEQFIREQIHSGRLPAQRGAHGAYRVKRSDVEKV